MAQIVNPPTSTSSTANSYRNPSAGDGNDRRYETPEERNNRLKDDPTRLLGIASPTALQSEFLNSAAVKRAIQLFLNCPQPEIWLTRLASIVNSIVSPHDNSFGDNPFRDLGNFFGGDKERAAALNTAYNNLNALVSEFYQWFNSLPVEQRDQFEDAGLNIALDGGSALTGSSAPSASIQPSGVVDASNIAFDNAVDFVTSVGGGLLGLIGAVQNTFKLAQNEKQISIVEDTTLADVNQKRLALGLSPLTKLSDVSSPKVLDKDELSSFGIRSKNEQEAASKQSRVTLETEVNPLYDTVDSHVRLGIGPYNEILAKIGNIQLATKLYNQMYQFELTNFNLEQQKIKNTVLSEYGGELASGEAQTALEEQSAQRAQFKRSAALDELGETLVKYKKDVLKDWIEKANSGSADSFIYSSLLMKSGLSLSDFMGPADAWLNYFERGSGILDDILGIFSPAKWLRPKKVIQNYNTQSKTTVYK